MNYLRIGILVLLGLFTGCSQGQNEAGTGDESLTAFTDVNVIPMDSERILQNQTVIIESGKIAEVGPAETVELPANAQIIEGEGRYLIPGLTDFHIHLLAEGEWVSYLAHGVTTVVNMSGTTSAAPEPLAVRSKINSGQMLAPNFYTTGPSLDGDPPNFAPVSDVVTNPEEVVQIVRRHKNQGYDFIKIYNGITPDVLKAVAKAAESHRMAVFGHIPREGGRAGALQRTLEAEVDMIAHGEEYFFTYFYEDVDSLLDVGKIPYRDTSDINKAVDMTFKTETAVTPNLSFIAATRRLIDDFQSVLEDPEFKYLHPEIQNIWKESNPGARPDIERFDKRETAKYDFTRQLTKKLNQKGVPLLLGTDTPLPGLFPGQSAHLELKEMVAAGLTPFEALATGTREPGNFIKKHLSEKELFGTIAPGLRADLVLLNENPLKDIGQISNISGVMVRGQWLPSDKLKAMREEIIESYEE